MLNMRKLVSLLVVFIASAASLTVTAEIQSYETRIGSVEFHNSFEQGYPTKESVNQLFDSYDFSNAVTAYTWATPLVGYWGIKRGFEQQLNAVDGDIVYLQGLSKIRPLLTSNNTTPYIVSNMNLAKTGPMVLEVPPGKLLGFIDDAWQRAITDLGVTGFGKGKGEKVIIVGPGQTVDAPDYHVVHAKTNHVWAAYRILDTDPDNAEKLLHGIHHYPYNQRHNPSPQRIIVPESYNYNQAQPRGLEFWRTLHEAYSSEVVEERDRLFLGMLQPLGIEKGKPFNPDKRQQTLLKEAAFVGESMLKAITFEKRFATAKWRQGSQWKQLLNTTPDQRAEFYDMFEGRAAFFYEATSMSETYSAKLIGKGTKYVLSYRDADNEWLDGGKDYRLRVPKDVPVNLFWDLSVYEVNSRIYIDNQQKAVNLGSRNTGLQQNDDGSIDLYFGPQPPEGKESNWITTVKGENWFAAFRFYGPLEPYYDGSFTLPDIEIR